MKSHAETLLFVSLWLFLFLGCPSRTFAGDDAIPSLQDFIKQSVTDHPGIRALKERTEVVRSQIALVKTTLLPSIEGGPFVTQGDPGGTSMLGWNGNLSASQRVGAGVAAGVRYTAWDFGRTSNAIRQAESETKESYAEEILGSDQLALAAAKDYLECARNKTLMNTLQANQKDAEDIYKTVDSLVRTGQRTSVEGHLAKVQVLEIQTELQVATTRDVQLQKLLGIPYQSDSKSCVPLEKISEGALPPLPDSRTKVETHPLYSVSIAREIAAKDRLETSKSELRPKLQFFGNGGYFSNDRLKTPWNYSVGTALVFPLWDGNKNSAEVKRLQAQTQQLAAESENVDLSLRVQALKAEERFKIAETRVKYLRAENLEAIRGFQFARVRYKDSTGRLAELRETFRNLIRVSESLSETEMELISSRLSWAWVGGSWSDWMKTKQ